MLDTSQLSGLAVGKAPIVISRMHNERPRLARWLAHYRAMGIEQFILIDNNSTDGTADFLLGEPGVVVLWTDEDFRLAIGGITWVNAARQALPPTIWTLYVDADEYLVYDGWPGKSVVEFVATVRDDCDAIPGFMLDMYPKGELADATPEGDLLASARYFDRDYRFRRRPIKPWAKSRPTVEIIGGPRVRLFSSVARESRTTWVAYFLRGQLDRVLASTPASWRRTIIENFPSTPPALKKTPFLRGRDVTYSNPHDVRNARYHAQNCVLLHYKFTADFAAKIDQEIDRARYYRFGAEYILYRKYLSKSGRLSFYSPTGSRELNGVEDLIDAGLIHDFSPYFEG